jgi:hypothetical protein
MVTKTPTTALFSWKTNILTPNDDEKRAGFIDDLDAFARRYWLSVRRRRSRYRSEAACPTAGTTASSDDAKLQAVPKSKLSSAAAEDVQDVSKRSEVEA